MKKWFVSTLLLLAILMGSCNLPNARVPTAFNDCSCYLELDSDKGGYSAGTRFYYEEGEIVCSKDQRLDIDGRRELFKCKSDGGWEHMGPDCTKSSDPWNPVEEGGDCCCSTDGCFARGTLEFNWPWEATQLCPDGFTQAACESASEEFATITAGGDGKDYCSSLDDYYASFGFQDADCRKNVDLDTMFKFQLKVKEVINANASLVDWDGDGKTNEAECADGRTSPLDPDDPGSASAPPVGSPREEQLGQPGDIVSVPGPLSDMFVGLREELGTDQYCNLDSKGVPLGVVQGAEPDRTVINYGMIPYGYYGCSADSKRIEMCDAIVGDVSPSKIFEECDADEVCIGYVDKETYTKYGPKCVKKQDMCEWNFDGTYTRYIPQWSAMCDPTDIDRERFARCIKVGDTLQIATQPDGSLVQCADVDKYGNPAGIQKCNPFSRNNLMTENPCESICEVDASGNVGEFTPDFSVRDDNNLFALDTVCSEKDSKDYVTMCYFSDAISDYTLGVPGAQQTKTYPWNFDGNCETGYGRKCIDAYDFRLSRMGARCTCEPVPTVVKDTLAALQGSEAKFGNSYSIYGVDKNCPFWCDTTPDVDGDDTNLVLYNRISCDPANPKRMVACAGGGQDALTFAQAPSGKSCQGGPGYVDRNGVSVNMPVFVCDSVPEGAVKLAEARGYTPGEACVFYCQKPGATDMASEDTFALYGDVTCDGISVKMCTASGWVETRSCPAGTSCSMSGDVATCECISGGGAPRDVIADVSDLNSKGIEYDGADIDQCKYWCFDAAGNPYLKGSDSVIKYCSKDGSEKIVYCQGDTLVEEQACSGTCAGGPGTRGIDEPFCVDAAVPAGVVELLEEKRDAHLAEVRSGARSTTPVLTAEYCIAPEMLSYSPIDSRDAEAFRQNKNNYVLKGSRFCYLYTGDEKVRSGVSGGLTPAMYSVLRCDAGARPYVTLSEPCNWCVAGECKA